MSHCPRCDNPRPDLPLACEAAEIQGLRPTDLRASSMRPLPFRGLQRAPFFGQGEGAFPSGTHPFRWAYPTRSDASS